MLHGSANVKNVGIIGMGVHLPEAIRDNSYWPAEITSKWPTPPPLAESLDGLDEDARGAVAASEKYRLDLFQGSRRRHVIADGQTGIELEVIAAREAMADAGVTAADIDMLLTHSAIPDYLCTTTACSVHERLGLPARCFAMAVEASSNSFQMQAALAEQAIRAGAARYALLTQSCTLSRILPRELPYSPWVGDAASAVVIGPVEDGTGFLAFEHRAVGADREHLLSPASQASRGSRKAA